MEMKKMSLKQFVGVIALWTVIEYLYILILKFTAKVFPMDYYGVFTGEDAEQKKEFKRKNSRNEKIQTAVSISSCSILLIIGKIFTDKITK